MLELYENIKKLRIERGLSQNELAKLAGYTDRSSIAKIEKGEVDLTQSKIMAFATALRVDVGDLMGATGEYSQDDLKTIGKLTSKDIELLNAYHSSSEETQSIIRKILGI